MPSRYFVPIAGIDPEQVRPDFIHAAISHWFDPTPAEHKAQTKPWSVSPLVQDPKHGVGVEIATLTAASDVRLAEATAPAAIIRLGSRKAHAGSAHRLHAHSWARLAGHACDHRWDLDFATPVTFRNGDRTSPMPQIRAMLEGLHRTWAAWSDTPLPPPTRLADVWVSDLDLRSVLLPVPVGRGRDRSVLVSGALGRLSLRCDDPEVAAVVGPLVRLAAYTGVGSMTSRGLGITRVHPHERTPPSPANPTNPAWAGADTETPSGVQASDQHKRPPATAPTSNTCPSRGSGVQTDIVCAAQSPAERGRVDRRVSLNSD